MIKDKVCISCKIKKDIANFRIRSDTKRYNNKCCDCLRFKFKEYYYKNKRKMSKKHDEWVERNKETNAEYQKKYRENNRASAIEYAKKYRENNKSKVQDNMRQYYKNNKKKIIDQHNEYIKNRLKTDVNFRIACNLRSRLYSAIKGMVKSGSAIKDLGCSMGMLKLNLEQKFYPNPETDEEMLWDNYGKWHIDHIKPLSSFDLTDREQFLLACNYKNLQPLWAKDNLTKGAK